MPLEENNCTSDDCRLYDYIPRNLRLLRYINDMSQEDIADMLHMSRTCYFALENGSKAPDIVTLCDIAAVYNIRLDYLISYDIAEEVLSLLRCDKEDIHSHRFLANYFKLSQGARTQVHSKLESLANRDRLFYNMHRDNRSNEEDNKYE